jgi:hypothetical protein
MDEENSPYVGVVDNGALRYCVIENLLHVRSASTYDCHSEAADDVASLGMVLLITGKIDSNPSCRSRRPGHCGIEQ